MEGSQSSPPKRRRTPQRRTLSCLPCREFKVRCNHQIPCDSCVRYGREKQCQNNPSPACLETAILTYPKRLKKTIGTQDKRKHIGEAPQEPDASSPGACTESHTGNGRTAVLTRRTVERSLNPSAYYETVEKLSSLADIQELHSPSRNQRLQCSISQFIPSYIANSTSSRDELLQWRIHMVEKLPTRTQCDFFCSYFFENINWIYQVLHIPTFRIQYALFWGSPVSEIDMIWLSLLYTVISVSALCLPAQLAEAMNFEAAQMRNLSRAWHSASRQCLHAGGYESNACLVQLQTFLVSQLYWLATKDVETLNS